MNEECIPIVEIQNKYNLNKKELLVLASVSGIFLTEQDNEICGKNELFYKNIEAYVESRKHVEENNIVMMNVERAKIFSMLDYTVITYSGKAFVTNKYKRISSTDLKYIVDSKDREKVMLFLTNIISYLITSTKKYYSKKGRKKLDQIRL